MRTVHSADRPPELPCFANVLASVEAIGKGVLTDHVKSVDEDARFPIEAIEALKAESLLSAYVPKEYGGHGLTITEICRLCETMGRYCASTAMIFAMHQIQVACIVNHAQSSSYFRQYLHDLVRHQYLLASATTEIGTGGDLGASICALEIEGDEFSLEKMAPVISYGQQADAILVTCRRSPDAPKGYQVHALVHRDACKLDEISGWDTLGFRGTCSSGFKLSAHGNVNQVLPVSYADIHVRSMHPIAHLTWGSLWLGIALDAVRLARGSVRKAARKNTDDRDIPSLRLAELDERLFLMRSSLHDTMREYEALAAAGDDNAFSQFGFGIRVNNVKVLCSEMVVEIVGKALGIVGISGYRNAGELSLSRHLRDAYGAALMVNNDRIRGHNAAMQIALR